MISAIQKQRLNRQILPFVDSLVGSERGLLLELNGQSCIIPECDIEKYVNCDSHENKIVDVFLFGENIIHPIPFTLEYLLEHWNIVQNWFFVPKFNTHFYLRINSINENGIKFINNDFFSFKDLSVSFYAFNGVDYFNCVIETSYQIAERTKNVTFKTK